MRRGDRSSHDGEWNLARAREREFDRERNSEGE